ncbi:hypothetical protein BFJ63_vAg17990 [Fusarium oxysporum f. sp. narcissi]|uniref:C2H2-type domain-containing protein n=1 Tax=Fusarium oxysporum f. sp. narcissi TaxID=451672 RepID=A0A4Q2UYF3_FUSOX|nr:hypothetical protein BFJ63_vAg17990 [Fusarium oxysporum f. sp. narcissi]
MTSTDQDLPNGLSTHTFTEVDIASQLMSHYITQGYDDQERAPVSVPCDYEDTSAPDQYTEQPTPHLSHNICNDVSQGETGSPTSNDMDNYPFKCGQLGCGHAFSDEAHQHQHQNKCKLVLEVLDWRKSMTENWTTEEQANSRRIVLFHRIQTYSQVKAICQPVSIKERIINYICISCIWWAEKGECYVTSVDIIRLLEQLIVPSNCFSVKEKNLIHCELEKLHPQIVHKTKPDTQEFFKIIMGFSDPKALSTGEDVKVFPWENLDSALENIIRSYMVLSRLTATAPNAGSGQRELATPEIETLTDDYPNTLCVTPLQDPMPPEGNAHQDGSQSRHVSVCQLPTQKNFPTLTSNVQLDSNSEHARTHGESTPRAKADKKKKGQRNNVVLVCPFCMKTFNGRHRKRNHERHWRTHTRERPYKCMWESCGKHYSRPDHMKRHANMCDHKSVALVTNDGVSESTSKFPNRGQLAPDSNPPSLQNELDLPGTLIQDESDTEIVEDEIVVCLRKEKDQHKHNALRLSLDKQTDGVYDTYQNTEEQARGSKLSAKIDDWGHPIADGTVTIYNKNTLLTNFDRGTQYDIPVRDLCPEVQNVLDRIYENLLQVDITQQEDEAEAEHIDIKRRIRATTQRNTSCSENTDAQQCRCHEETHSTIDKLQSILPESKGLDLIRISAHELKNILEMAQDILSKPINHIKVFLVSRQGLGAHRDPWHNRGTP